MKSIVLALAATLALSASAAPLSVAVFPFETGPGVDVTYGQAFAGFVRTDLALLPQFRRQDPPAGSAAVSFGATVGTADAAAIGRQTGADAIVTGQVMRQGRGFIVALKTVDTATGQASGASIRGETPGAITGLAAVIAARAGTLLLHRPAEVVSELWPDASIVGSRNRSAAQFPLHTPATIWVRAIDGRETGQGEHSWSSTETLAPGRHQISASVVDSDAVGHFTFYWDAPPGAHGTLEVRSADIRHAQVDLISQPGSRHAAFLMLDPKSGHLVAAARLEVRLSGGPDRRMIIDPFIPGPNNTQTSQQTSETNVPHR